MRLAYLSNRDHVEDIWWRNITPPFERAFGSMPDCAVVTAPRLRRATFRADRPAWLSAVKTVRRADAVFWIQGHLRPPAPLWALAYAQPVAIRATLVVDAWGQHLDNLAAVVRHLHIHRCYVQYTQAFEQLRARHPSLGFAWLPAGANTDVFMDLGRTRDIYAFWMGRRHEALHERLTEYCAARGLTYRFTTGFDPATTEELTDIAARSRYFVATPPDVNNVQRTGGFSPVVSRYVEGPAAGARLFGVPALASEMEMYFDDGDFIACAVDGSDLADVLEAADADPEWEARRVQLRDRFRREHSWHTRAQQIYDDLSTFT